MNVNSSIKYGWIALRYENCKSLYFPIQVGDKKHGGYIAEKPPRNGFPKCGNFGW